MGKENIFSFKELYEEIIIFKKFIPPASMYSCTMQNFNLGQSGALLLNRDKVPSQPNQTGGKNKGGGNSTLGRKKIELLECLAHSRLVIIFVNKKIVSFTSYDRTWFKSELRDHSHALEKLN